MPEKVTFWLSFIEDKAVYLRGQEHAETERLAIRQFLKVRANEFPDDPHLEIIVLDEQGYTLTYAGRYKQFVPDEKNN